MRNVRLTIIPGIVATALATLTAAIPAAASASAHGSAAKPPTVMTHRIGMTIVPTVRILGATPRKPGYFTVLSANGQEAIVPDYLRTRVESRMKQESIHPKLKRTLQGDCGSSFVNITTKANGYMVFRNTGFTVNQPAVYFSWRYTVAGPDYASITFLYSDPLNLDISWADPVSSGHDYPNGTWSGKVSTASYAELWTGAICYSAGPEVDGYV